MGCFCPKKIINKVYPQNSGQKVPNQSTEHPTMQIAKKRIQNSREDHSTYSIMFEEQMQSQHSNNRRNNQNSNFIFNFEDIRKQEVQQSSNKRQQELENKSTIQTNLVIQKVRKPLSQSCQRLLNTQRYKATRNQMNFERMMQQAVEAHNQSLFQKQKSIYDKCLDKIENLAYKLSNQSIHEAKAHIYSSYVNIAVSQNNEEEADSFLNKTLQSYKKTLPCRTHQQRIALMNNYSIFKRNCGKIEEAKKYLQEAIDLMNKYYTIHDQRRYLALINLACLLYETNQAEEAGIVTKTVVTQCKDKQIVELALKNQHFYRK